MKDYMKEQKLEKVTKEKREDNSGKFVRNEFAAVSKQEYTKEKEYHPESHIRDVNSHLVFQNNTLTCQLLRDYLELPIFEELEPEDIEDVSERYRELLGVEFQADTVKAINLQRNGQREEVFVVSLIEHKSYVDYDISMQMLRYMCAIWYDYKLRQEKRRKGISHTKGFRYPMIIPVVYYEGKKNWTAPMELSSRIALVGNMKEYVPDFVYRLIRVQDYTNEELQEKQDEMSLVMMINKVQTEEDYEEFQTITKEYADNIYQNATEEIRYIYREIIWALLMKMKVPADEAQKLVEEIGGRGMGYLFENLKGIDIQAERKRTEKARKKAEDAEKKAEDAQKKAEAAQKKAEAAEKKAEDAKKEIEAVKKDTQQKVDDISKKFVQMRMMQGDSLEDIQRGLMVLLDLNESEAVELVKNCIVE